MAEAPVPPPWIGVAAIAGVVAIQYLNPQFIMRIPFLRPQKCKRCLGVGNNICVDCKGRGKQGGLFTNDPLEKCPTCQGRGKQLCKVCNSTGVANRWLYRVRKR